MLRFCSATLGGAVQLVFCKSLATISAEDSHSFCLPMDINLWFGKPNTECGLDQNIKCQGSG